MKTVLQLKTDAKKVLWPTGEAENLVAAHDIFFVEALVELQRWCSLLKLNNTTVIRGCATYFDCGLTVVEAPRGQLRRLYTIANDNWCSKVYYQRREHLALVKYQMSLKQLAIFPSQTRSTSKTVVINGTPTVVVTNTILPTLPAGLRFSGPDSDSKWGRAQVGVWSLHRKRIYIGPWIQSNETVVIEWDGPKYDWTDFDILNDYWTVVAERAVRAYVNWRHEAQYGCGDQKIIAALYTDWLMAQSEAILENDDLLKRDPNIFIPAVLQTLEEQQADAIPAADASDVADAFIADIGDTGNTKLVRELIDGWNPSILLTGGDNVYSADYITSLADNFQAYVDADKFKPAWGNHDWDNDSDLANLILYTKAPGNYYSVVSGDVEYFLVSSDPREPDQNYVDSATSTETSVVGQWLKAKLALSTAVFKVVICHHAPFSSDSTHGSSAWMQWPFLTWGADLVLSGHGHDYERLSVGGLDYIVAGTGGQSLYSFGAPVTGSLVRNASYGALKIVSNCKTLTVGFYGTDGTKLDELIINAT